MTAPPIREPRLHGKATWLAPIVSAVLLVGMLAGGAIMLRGGNSVDVETVRGYLDQIPNQLGNSRGAWVRTRVVPIPSGQAYMMDLAASSSNEYLRLGESPPVNAILFIAFCEDARSMVGHHPPNCYPSSGWKMDTLRTRDIEVPRPDGRIILSRIYYFSREGTPMRELHVASGFFAADEFFSGTLEGASEVVKPSLLGGMGLFQFQILLQGAYSEADVDQYAEEILLGIPRTVFDGTIGLVEIDGSSEGVGAK